MHNSPRLDVYPMIRPSVTLTLGENPIVSMGTDGRIIDFGATRFRVHAQRFQKTLYTLASEFATELGVNISGLSSLSSEPDEVLKSQTYCVFDFIDVRSRSIGGFIRIRWIPLAVFTSGKRVFSLHASYDGKGARLVGITMFLDGEDEYTRCSTLSSASKVGRSFLRTYVTVGAL